MQQNAQSTSRIKFPSITIFELIVLGLCMIIGAILTYSENIILSSIYTFMIFVLVGMNMKNIKAAISSDMLPGASVLIILNTAISFFGYWPASIGFIIYFIILLQRYRTYKKLTGG